MENLFQMNFTREQVNGISNLGLAHIGDGAYELMVRSYLCAKGNQTVKTLHRDSIRMVNAVTQAAMAEALMPILTEEEMGYFRRGKNSHTHAAPKAATPQQYALATGLETLFGALYLYGRMERLNELFRKGIEENGL
jgi:ribonuclease-3 family protein